MGKRGRGGKGKGAGMESNTRANTLDRITR